MQNCVTPAFVLVAFLVSGCASRPEVPLENELIGATIDVPPSNLQSSTLTDEEKSASALQDKNEPEDGGRSRPISLTYDKHPSGAALEIRATARQSFLYAQLATNAYNESDSFKLLDVEGPFDIERHWSGFGAQYYKIANPTGGRRCVIAFRGTDFFQPVDWVFGNLLNIQYKRGLRYFDTLRASSQCGDNSGQPREIAVVGHSLGGAIATYISLRRNSAPAFMFNTSPRLTRGKAIVNERVAVSQYSEVLAVLRHVTILAGGTYTTINCRKGNPIGRHAIRPLAECLTAIAASDAVTRNDEDIALLSARENGITFEGPLLEGVPVGQALLPDSNLSTGQN